MHLKIHGSDVLKDTHGKTTDVMGTPSFKEIAFKNGKPAIEIKLSYTVPSGFESSRLIERNATIVMDQEDVTQLFRVILDSKGLDLCENDALRIINRLSRDLLSAKKALTLEESS